MRNRPASSPSREELLKYHEPMRETRTTGDASGEGYYPTKAEWKYLYQYEPRIVGDVAGGDPSDPRGQAPSGLFPYPSATPGFYEAHPSLLPFADPYLGYFVGPGNGLGFRQENRSTGADGSLALDAPFLTRGYNPERATFKLGLAYLDVLSLTGTVLNSQYQGPAKFAPDEEDGWLAAISLGLRLVIPITPDIYLAAAGEVYYLPTRNRVGFAVGGLGGGGLGTGVNLRYERYVGGWWIGAGDNLGIYNRFSDYTDYLSANEIAQAGRYRFGRDDRQGVRGSFFDDQRLLLNNRAYITAVGQVSTVWRLTADLSREDTWEFDGFTHRPSVTQASAIVDYDGQDWRFAPFMGVKTTAYDEFDGLRHEVFAGIQGPLSPFVSLYARVGYGFSTGDEFGDDGVIGEVGITHEVGPYTRESLFAGHGVSEFRLGRGFIGNYVRYTLNQRFGYRSDATLFTQISRTDDLETHVQSDSFSSGVNFRFVLTDFTELTIGGSFDRFDRDEGGVENRWVASARLTHRIRPNLYGTLLYQYEDGEFARSFEEDYQEHLYLLSLTQLF